MRILILVMLCVLVPLSALSAPANCNEIVKSKFSKAMLVDPEICYCGNQLSNLTVTLPRGLHVEAVCNLRFASVRNSRVIDLPREKLTLDSSRLGDYPHGYIFLSGVTEEPIVGTVTFEEGPAGTLWFNAPKNRRGPVFWERNLKSLILGSELDFKNLRATTLKEGQCWQAEASIKIHDPVVTLGDTSEAGTRANIDVLRVAEYKPCPARDMEHPEARLTKGQPKDVAELIHRIIGCNEVQGDWPYADEFQKALYADESVKLNCAALPQDEDRIRASHLNNEIVGQRINAAKLFNY